MFCIVDGQDNFGMVVCWVYVGIGEDDVFYFVVVQ